MKTPITEDIRRQVIHRRKAYNHAKPQIAVSLGISIAAVRDILKGGDGMPNSMPRRIKRAKARMRDPMTWILLLGAAASPRVGGSNVER